MRKRLTALGQAAFGEIRDVLSFAPAHDHIGRDNTAVAPIRLRAIGDIPGATFQDRE